MRVKHLRAFQLAIIACAFFLVLPRHSYAQLLPQTFTIEGRLYDTGTPPMPITGSVNIIFEILDSSQPTCILYREQQSSVSLASGTDPTALGVFALKLGAGSVTINAGVSLEQTFLAQNYTGALEDGTSCTITAQPGDARLLRIKTQLVGASAWDTLSPDTVITPVPSAMVAETLQGSTPTSFINVVSDATNLLTQANVQWLFNSTNFPLLSNMLAGNDNKFISSQATSTVDLNGQRLTNLAAPIFSTDAVTKNYADTELGGNALNLSGVSNYAGDGKTLVWNQTANQWVAQTVQRVASITAGTGLLGGTILNSGTFSVDVGTLPNQIVQVNPAGLLPGLDGSLLTNLNATRIGTRSVASTLPSGGQILTFNTTSAQWQPTNQTGITNLTGDVVANGPGSVTATIQSNAITSAKIKSTGIAINQLVMTDGLTGANLVYGTCSLNQVYQWAANGWVCKDVSAMLGNVNAAPGVYGNATQVAQVAVDAQGRVTALTNVNIAFPVTLVAGRAGSVTLSTTDISGLGTAALKDYGTLPGNLVQLDAAGRYPAADGSQLTNLNTSNFAGVVSPTMGGTGVSNPTAHSVLIGEGSSAITPLVGGTGTVLQGVTGGDPTFNSTLQLGLNGSAPGKIVLANMGSTGTATIQALNVPGSYNFNLPSSAGTSGQVLTSSGGGSMSWTNPNSGTVTSLSVTSANGFSGTVANNTTTPTFTVSTTVNGIVKGDGTAISAATSGTDYSAGTAALATGILKSTTTTGALSIAAATDFPTLNQNTTGTAANVTGIVAVAHGGTGVTTAGSNLVFAGPVSTSGGPSFRALASADLPAGTASATGINGYMPYFTSATALTNTNVIFDSNKLGVGVDPVSTLQSGGSFGTQTKVITGTSTASYTASDADSNILVNANAAVTINLPDASSVTGRQYTIKKIDSSTNSVKLQSSSSNIDGVSNRLLYIPFEFVTVVSDGANWDVISTNTLPSGAHCGLMTNIGGSTTTVKCMGYSPPSCPTGYSANSYTITGTLGSNTIDTCIKN